MNDEFLKQFEAVINEMCEAAGFDEDYAGLFYEEIISDDDVLNEFLVYIKTGKFTGQNIVAGYSIVDVMVWQMDHFKAFLDRDSLAKNGNECAILLTAFDTFMKMKKDPEKYVRLMTEESGSDYDGKF